MTSITSTESARPGVLHIALWIAQIMAAGIFIMAGFLKTSTSIEELSLIIPWAKEAKVLIRFIGIAELLGAVGLILPAALRIAPKLTVWAAYGLTLTMILASIFHIARGEISGVPPTIVLGLLSGFIGWGRSAKALVKT